MECYKPLALVDIAMASARLVRKFETIVGRAGVRDISGGLFWLPICDFQKKYPSAQLFERIRAYSGVMKLLLLAPSQGKSLYLINSFKTPDLGEYKTTAMRHIVKQQLVKSTHEVIGLTPQNDRRC